MKRHVFRHPENRQTAFYQQYTLPSRVSISPPLPEMPLITYTFIYHGGILSPIQEIDCFQISPYRPLFILKEGLLGCAHYGVHESCNFSDTMEVERFTIFPEHLLKSDPFKLNRVICCENQDSVFILTDRILFSVLIRDHIIPYHTRHFDGHGIQIRCGMCSTMEHDAMEYLLWESKIYHQLTAEDAYGYRQLLTHYQQTRDFLPGNMERLLFVLSQFNHLFSANVSSFSIQVQFIQKTYVNIILHKLGINQRIIYSLYELDNLLDYIINVRPLIHYLQVNMSDMYQESFNQVHRNYQIEMGRFNAWFKLLPWGYMELVRKNVRLDRLDSYLSNEAVHIHSYMPELDPYTWSYRLMKLPAIAALIGAGLGWKLAALLPFSIQVATYGYLPAFLASFGGAFAAELATHAPYALSLSRYKSQKEKKEGKKTRKRHGFLKKSSKK